MRNLKSGFLILTGAALAFVIGGCATVPYRERVVESYPNYCDYYPEYCDELFLPPPPALYGTQPIIVVNRDREREHEKEPAVTVHSREDSPQVTRTPARTERREPVITRPEPERRVPERTEPKRAEPQPEQRHWSRATVVDRNDDRAAGVEREWQR